MATLTIETMNCLSLKYLVTEEKPPPEFEHCIVDRINSRLLMELVRETTFEGIGAHQCWSLFKYSFLRAQEQVISKCQKSSRQGEEVNLAEQGSSGTM